MNRIVVLAVLLCSHSAHAQDRGASATSLRDMLAESERIVFLGDSITFAGHYVAFFDAWLYTQSGSRHPLVLDMGLSSETVSGLSEEGHAGGRFPRPDLAERLSRVLELAKPDLVFACYGINCGIYQPFDDGRFRRYKLGIRALREAVESAGARLVLITPPTYDDLRKQNSFSYNEVLDRYSAWLLSLREQGWVVVDLHEPMNRQLARRRESDPEFTFQPDAVHPNEAGHWFMAQRLILAAGDESAARAESPEAMLAAKSIDSKEVLKLFRERSSILRNAYVAAAGHKRPGVPPGLPVDAAHERAAALMRQIEAKLPRR